MGWMRVSYGHASCSLLRVSGCGGELCVVVGWWSSPEASAWVGQPTGLAYGDGSRYIKGFAGLA
jgi:hypothetical protein